MQKIRLKRKAEAPVIVDNYGVVHANAYARVISCTNHTKNNYFILTYGIFHNKEQAYSDGVEPINTGSFQWKKEAQPPLTHVHVVSEEIEYIELQGRTVEQLNQVTEVVQDRPGYGTYAALFTDLSVAEELYATVYGLGWLMLHPDCYGVPFGENWELDTDE